MLLTKNAKHGIFHSFYNLKPKTMSKTIMTPEFRVSIPDLQPAMDMTPKKGETVSTSVRSRIVDRIAAAIMNKDQATLDAANAELDADNEARR